MFVRVGRGSPAKARPTTPGSPSQELSLISAVSPPEGGSPSYEQHATTGLARGGQPGGACAFPRLGARFRAGSVLHPVGVVPIGDPLAADPTLAERNGASLGFRGSVSGRVRISYRRRRAPGGCGAARGPSGGHGPRLQDRAAERESTPLNYNH